MIHAPAQQARAVSKNPALFLQSRGRDVTWFGEATVAQEFFVVEISEETKRSPAPSSPSRAGRAPRAAGAPPLWTASPFDGREGNAGKEEAGKKSIRENDEERESASDEAVRGSLSKKQSSFSSPFLHLCRHSPLVLSSLPFLFLSNRPPRKWPRRRSSPTAPGLHSHPRTGKAAPPPQR